MGRRYNVWGGNPDGNPEDKTRCIEEVAERGGWLFYQCQRKRGHGPDGLYCKQHAKKHIPIEETKKEVDDMTYKITLRITAPSKDHLQCAIAAGLITETFLNAANGENDVTEWIHEEGNVKFERLLVRETKKRTEV